MTRLRIFFFCVIFNDENDKVFSNNLEKKNWNFIIPRRISWESEIILNYNNGIKLNIYPR